VCLFCVTVCLFCDLTLYWIALSHRNFAFYGSRKRSLIFPCATKRGKRTSFTALTSLLLNHSLRFFNNYDLFMYIIVMKDKSMATLVAKCCYINVLTNFDFLFFVLRPMNQSLIAAFRKRNSNCIFLKILLARMPLFFMSSLVFIN
jgi:hypothetical protein